MNNCLFGFPEVFFDYQLTAYDDALPIDDKILAIRIPKTEITLCMGKILKKYNRIPHYLVKERIPQLVMITEI